jgi:type IV pilus biogenesis protein CpaD/CtpE
MSRSALLLFPLLSAAPLAAQPAAVPAAPVDPVASVGCRQNPAAFGCANAANLARMAAPDDLLNGRAPSLARAVQEAAAVARLDADKAKDLRREGTDGAGGGSPR